MADVFSKTKRSEVMSRIRSRGNRDTELALARLLRVNHITGWRRQIVINVRSSRRKEAQTENRKSEIGNLKLIGASSPRLLRVKVDFVFRRVRLALFVDGCFWHGCPRHATWPAHRAAWWRRKIEGNQKRDRLVNRALRRAGWKVVRIWEHALPRLNAKGQRLKVGNGRQKGKHRTSNEERLVRRIEKHLK